MKYQVTVEPLGTVIEVEQGQTILDAALRSGLALPHACSQGVCSACKIDIIEGEVDIGDASEFALLDSERAESKCLACCATPLTDLVVEAAIDSDPDAKRYPVLDYQSVVTNIVDVSPNIKSVFLALGDDGISFQAGQYIHLHVPGLDGLGQKRAFSIASPPSSRNVIELNISLVEGGEGTNYLHNKLQVGDALNFSGPYGQFFLRASQPEPIIFLAAGSGLSGVKSMVMELMESNDTRPITLIFGARTQEEVFYRELFEQYARDHSNFTFLSTVNDGLCDSHEDEQWGCIHQAAKAHFGGVFEGYNAYICGPPPMVDSCVTTLMLGRCFERHLFVENFYNSGSKQRKPKNTIFKSI